MQQQQWQLPTSIITFILFALGAIQLEICWDSSWAHHQSNSSYEGMWILRWILEKGEREMVTGKENGRQKNNIEADETQKKINIFFTRFPIEPVLKFGLERAEMSFANNCAQIISAHTHSS